MSALEHLLALLDGDDGQERFADLTPLGIEHLRARIRTALPYVPTILLTGEWADWTSDVFLAARDAVLGGAPCEKEDEELAISNETADAIFVVALVVGVALGQALSLPNHPGLTHKLTH